MKRECPRCGVEQSGETECEICGFVWEPVSPDDLSGYSASPARSTKKSLLRRLFLPAALVAAVAFFWFQQRPSQDGGNAGNIEWTHGYETGMAQARDTGLPAMLFFTADWCGYCRKLGRNAFSDAGVVDLSTRLVPVLVDIDRDSVTPETYNIKGVPTVIFLDRRGDTHFTVVGFRDTRVYTRAMEDLLASP